MECGPVDFCLGKRYFKTRQSCLSAISGAEKIYRNNQWGTPLAILLYCGNTFYLHLYVSSEGA